MSFIEILGLFVCFCGIQTALDLGKDYARAKLMQRKVNQTIDSAVGTVWRSVLKYKVAREARIPFVNPGDPEFMDYTEESKEGDEVR